MLRDPCWINEMARCNSGNTSVGRAPHRRLLPTATTTLPLAETLRQVLKAKCPLCLRATIKRQYYLLPPPPPPPPPRNRSRLCIQWRQLHCRRWSTVITTTTQKQLYFPAKISGDGTAKVERKLKAETQSQWQLKILATAILRIAAVCHLRHWRRPLLHSLKVMST